MTFGRWQFILWSEWGWNWRWVYPRPEMEVFTSWRIGWVELRRFA